ncbi:unnamed protein product [Rotaria sordida]|nr:unnamed protein product [Rotaria sordida]CAF3994672.1 unnamed protein product [Rotaria sordida]CAF4003367.1 unnamed protein product [Rotaria sordida]
MPLQSTVANSSPTFDLRKTVWSPQSKRRISSVDRACKSLEGEQSTMKLQDKSLSTDKRKSFRRIAGNICSPTCKMFLCGITIGLLFAGIALAAIVTLWLKTASTSTSSTSTTRTTTTTSTDTTSTTTTTQTTSTTTTTSTTFGISSA